MEKERLKEKMLVESVKKREIEKEKLKEKKRVESVKKRDRDGKIKRKDVGRIS